MVFVPASVLDRSGGFVADLSAHDFQVLVDGEPVEIASFEAESETPADGRCLGSVIVRDNLTGRIGTITLALFSTGVPR